MTNKFINGDCMDYLPELKDNHFNLAIVDPPYGIGDIRQSDSRKKNQRMDWNDFTPDQKYFSELERISINRIIWGANYFPQFLFGSMGWIFWDKGQELNQSDGELAYSSFNRALRRVTINRVELLKDGTIHPTQKPIKLYRWLLQNYAKPGDLILDTHVGSGSSLVACIMEGFDYIGYEIDKEYYDGATKRIKAEQQKISLF